MFNIYLSEVTSHKVQVFARAYTTEVMKYWKIQPCGPIETATNPYELQIVLLLPTLE